MKQREMSTQSFSRRNFLLGAAVSAGTAILTACGGSKATDTPKAAAGTTAPAAGAGTSAPAATSGGAAATTAPAATKAASGSAAAPAATTGTSGAAQTTPNVPPTGAVTINWFAARAAGDYRAKEVAAFNQANKTLQISYQEQGADTTSLHDKFVTVATSKDSSADLVSMDVPFVPEFAAAGWTIPVDDVIAGGEREKFFKGTLDGATYEGKLYGIPWYNNGPGLYYRKDLLDAKGLKPPKTYDELISTAKAVQTPEVIGFAMQLNQGEGGIINWLEYLWAYGGDLVDEKFQVVLDKGTLGVDSMQKVFDLVYKEKVTPEAALQYKLGPDVVNIFRSGGAAMMRMWYGNAGPIFQADSKITKEQWDITPLPSKDGSKPGPGCLGDWNLGVSKFSKKPKETIEVIRILTDLAHQKAAMIDGAYLPSRSAVFDDPEVQTKIPYSKTAQASFANQKPRPVTPFYPQMSADAIQPNFGAIMAKQKSVEQGIKDMADGMRKVIKQ